MTGATAYVRGIIPSDDREKDDFYPTPPAGTRARVVQPFWWGSGFWNLIRHPRPRCAGDGVMGEYDVRREAPCPRCHEVCGWCSDYRFMHGRINLPGTRRKCTVPGIEPDAICPVCEGEKRVWMTVQYEPMPAIERTTHD